MIGTTHDDRVAEGRGRIDNIDTEIIRLVRERRGASAGVQQARVDAGEPRLQNAREIIILKRYGADLGNSGTALAMTILNLCRGPNSVLNPR